MGGWGHISSMITTIANNNRMTERIKERRNEFFNHKSENEIHLNPRRKSVVDDKDLHTRIDEDKRSNLLRDFLSLVIVIFFIAIVFYYLFGFAK